MKRLDLLVLLGAFSMLGCPVDESQASGTDDGDESSSAASTSGTSSTSLPTTTTTTTSTTTETPTTTGLTTSTTTDATTTVGATETGVSTGPATSSGSSTTSAEGACAVDLLFIVDNSGSMMEEQGALLSAIPDFIDDLGDADLHAMVVDVDADALQTCRDTCDTNPECFEPMGCQTMQFECLIPCATCVDTGFTCPAPAPADVCDVTLGAGVVHPMGAEASNIDCDFSSGERYIDTTRENFANKLVCAAQVGVGSTASTELVMGAMVDAVTAGSDADECNEGFLRDEALLVVVFVTDEDDDATDSPGNPTFWKLQLESAKGGSDEDIIVLGIFGDNDQPNATCVDDPENGGAEPSPRLRQFVDSFDEQGLSGSVCAGSFAPFFNDAVDVIGNVCGA